MIKTNAVQTLLYMFKTKNYQETITLNDKR
jgi:hypothetical protein